MENPAEGSPSSPPRRTVVRFGETETIPGDDDDVVRSSGEYENAGILRSPSENAESEEARVKRFSFEPIDMVIIPADYNQQGNRLEEADESESPGEATVQMTFTEVEMIPLDAFSKTSALRASGEYQNSVLDPVMEESEATPAPLQDFEPTPIDTIIEEKEEEEEHVAELANGAAHQRVLVVPQSGGVARDSFRDSHFSEEFGYNNATPGTLPPSGGDTRAPYENYDYEASTVELDSHPGEVTEQATKQNDEIGSLSSLSDRMSSSSSSVKTDKSYLMCTLFFAVIISAVALTLASIVWADPLWMTARMSDSTDTKPSSTSKPGNTSGKVEEMLNSTKLHPSYSIRRMKDLSMAKKEVYTFGYNDFQAPTDFVSRGRLRGLAVHVVSAVCDVMKRECHHVLTPTNACWNNELQHSEAIMTGRVDGCVNWLYTSLRSLTLDYTSPIFTYAPVVGRLYHSVNENFTSLDGVKIGYPKTSPLSSVCARRGSTVLKAGQLVGFESVGGMVSAFRSKEVNFVFVTAEDAAQYPNLTLYQGYDPRICSDGHSHVMVKKGSDVPSWFDEGLTRVMDSGTYANICKLSEQNFGVPSQHCFAT